MTNDVGAEILAWGARGREFKSLRPDHFSMDFQSIRSFLTQSKQNGLWFKNHENRGVSSDGNDARDQRKDQANPEGEKRVRIQFLRF